MNQRSHDSVRAWASFALLVGIILSGQAPIIAATYNYQNLTIGPNGALVGGLGDIFNIRGDLINNSTQNIVWDTHLSQIGFNASGPHNLNWTGTEQGRGNAGYIANFAVGSLVLPLGASVPTSGGGALYTRVLTLGGGISQLTSITGAGLSIHYNPGSPQNVYLNFQTYALGNGYFLSPAAAPADFNALWNGTTGHWTDATKWSGSVSPLNSSSSVTLYDATINSGTVTLDQTIGYIQKLNLGSGSTLMGAFAVTPWDTFTWGTVGNNNPSTISGGAAINANGDLTIVGDSARNLDNATINNHAGYNATWAAGNSDINFSNAATFNNYGGFIMQNNRGLGHNGGTGTFNNFGTFTKNAGAGTTQIGSANLGFNNLGSISVETGTVEFDTPLAGPVSGSVSISSGASFVLADGLTTFQGSFTNAGSLNVGDAIGAPSSAVLQLQFNNQINNASVLTIKSDGLLDVNSLSESVGALVVSGGDVAIGTGSLLPSSLSMIGGAITSAANGKLTLSSGITATSNASGNPALISGQVDLGGPTRTFTVNRGSGVVDLVIAGNISNGGLIKSGLGIMTQSGNNSYGGGTQLQAGTLNINSPTAIGTGMFSISGGTTIDNTSAGPITLTTNNPQSWLGSFTFTGTQGLNFGSGAVTLNSNPTITVSANVLTVGPIGNGTGTNLVKAGAGTLYVSGGASYTGTTSVNAGTMTVSAGPFASSASTVSPQAVMNFVNGANAGSGMFSDQGSSLGAITAGLIQFTDPNTTAGFGNYTINGGIGTVQNGGSGGNGAIMAFFSGTSAGHATITVQGAPIRYAVTSAQALFNAGSTAGNALITTNGGSDSFSGGAAPGGLALFSGNATAGAATLVTNSGSLGGLPGLTEFKDTANAGTAKVTINNGTFNKFLNSASAAGATINVNGGGTADFENNARAGIAMITIATNGLAIFNGDGTLPAVTADSATMTVNAGGQAQFHLNASGGSANITIMDTLGGAGTAYTRFYDTANAGNATMTNRGGQQQQSIGGGHVEFHNSSSAGSAAITNLGATDSNGAFGGETDLYDSSNAGTNAIAPATITNGGSTAGGSNGFGGHGGVSQFYNSSKAGTANIINNPAADNGHNGIGGYTYFNDSASADHATIVNNGGIYDNFNKPSQSGHTVFFSSSTADHANLIANGAQFASTGAAGEIDFYPGSTAGSATITANGAGISGAAGGTVQFNSQQSSSASDAGSAAINVNGGTFAGAKGAFLYFGGRSTAANAVITTNGTSASGAFGGVSQFDGTANAGASTIITNGGTGGGAGGLTEFTGQLGSFFPSGGTARVVTNSGGTFDVSFMGGAGLTVGSIEGAGRYQLGGSALAAGSLNSDTTVSGLILDGGLAGGSLGKLTKQGTGKLTLTSPNTYTGATTIGGGILSTNLLPNGGIAGGIGQSSGAAANLVLNGGLLQYTGTGGSTDRLYSLGANGGGLDSSGTGPINFSNPGAIAFPGSGPRTLTFTGSNSGANTLAQTITDGTGGATSIVKSGSGTWVLNIVNSYTGSTTITAGTLRYGSSDPAIQNNAQAYTLSPANPAGNQTGFSLGLDFNVNAGRVITITKLGVFDNGRDGFANGHIAYIYNRDTQGVLTSLPFSAGATGALSSDGYRFLSLSTPLTLSAGNYTVVADFGGTDLEVNAGLNGGQNQGTTSDGGGAISYVGIGRYGSPGSFPSSPGGAVPYTFGAGSFVFNSLPAGRIPGDVTINGPTAVLDLGNNQNGNVATVMLDGGGSISGTGTSRLTSRTSFQMKSGTVTAILAGAGTPLVKTTTGAVTLSGANTYSGDTAVSAGTLKFNITSGAPTIASGVTATVASGATLELAGSVSALGTFTGNREHIVNNSLGAAGQPAGFVVSGTHQIVGDIDGSGSMSVASGSDLQADHIIQGALVIGGTASSLSLVTIDASDAFGNPLGQSSSFSMAGSLLANDAFGAGNIGFANLSGIGSELAVPSPTSSIGGGYQSSIPEPSTLLLVLVAIAASAGPSTARWSRSRRNVD